jgi:hypothetical protein
MTTNTTEHITEGAASTAIQVSGETINRSLDERWDEDLNEGGSDSETESEAESDNESVIDYGVETTLSEGFARLHWSVFEDISKVQVHTDVCRQSSELSPFHGHAIAKQPATDPPCYKIAFDIEALSYIETPGYKRPGRLRVQRPDGGVVTIADVVEQLSPYFDENKEDILWVKAPMLDIDPYSTRYDELVWNTKFFFAGFSIDVIEDEYYAIGVEVEAEE